MARYIDVDKLLKLIDEVSITITAIGMDTDLLNAAIHYAKSAIKVLIRNQSLTDVKEVKHGKWSRGVENGNRYAHCSACDRKMNDYCYGYGYCPLCGARMDGDN